MHRLEKRAFIYLDKDRYLDLDRFCYMKNGFPIYFSTTQILVLRCLSENLCSAVSNEDIIRYVCGEYGGIEVKELYVYMNRIRKKLEDRAGQSRYLLSVRGFGYLLYSYVRS